MGSRDGAESAGPEGEGSRRRGRGGRGRDRDRRDFGDQAVQGQLDIGEAASRQALNETPSGQEGRDPRYAVDTTDVPSPAAIAAAATADAAPSARTAMSTTDRLPEPPRAAQPIRIEPYALPAADLRAIASAAGLEWVGSDADKVQAVQAAMAAEPQPAHVPREPRPVAVVDEGPLVLVETRKDLSQVRLPFEQAS